MKQKKHQDTPTECENTPGTDKDDIYLPVCCGEFGLRQAAGLRELWEATWSQDRRGRGESSKETTQAVPTGHDDDTENGNSGG